MSEHQISKIGTPTVAVEFTQIGAMVDKEWYTQLIHAFGRTWPVDEDCGDEGRAVIAVQIVPEGDMHVFSACRGEYLARVRYGKSHEDGRPHVPPEVGERPVTIGDVEAISNALAGNAAASAAFGNMVGRLIEAENRAEYREMARLHEVVDETRRLSVVAATACRSITEAADCLTAGQEVAA